MLSRHLNFSSGMGDSHMRFKKEYLIFQSSLCMENKYVAFETKSKGSKTFGLGVSVSVYKTMCPEFCTHRPLVSDNKIDLLA